MKKFRHPITSGISHWPPGSPIDHRDLVQETTDTAGISQTQIVRKGDGDQHTWEESHMMEVVGG